VRLFIHGSRARGEARPSSDLDVLVSPLDDGQEAYFDTQVVQHLLKPTRLPETSPLRAVPLDVHLDTQLPAEVRERAEREGILIQGPDALIPPLVPCPPAPEGWSGEGADAVPPGWISRPIRNAWANLRIAENHLVWALQDADKAADAQGRADALAWGLTVAVEAVATAARRVLASLGEAVPQGDPEDGILVDILGAATRAVPHAVSDGPHIRPALSPQLRGVLLSVADALDAREAGADLRYQADLEEHVTSLQAGLRGAWVSWLVALGAPTSLTSAPEDAPDHADPAEQALQQRVERLREMGMTAESIISDLLLGSRTIDRMKEAVSLGLLRAGDGTAWTRAELLHAVSFAMRTAGLSAEGVRSLFTKALREVLRRRASGSDALALGLEDLAREILNSDMPGARTTTRRCGTTTDTAWSSCSKSSARPGTTSSAWKGWPPSRRCSLAPTLP
jgi:predicted nucleotidyltransferase